MTKHISAFILLGGFSLICVFLSMTIFVISFSRITETFNSCPIPPGFFDSPKTIIKTVYKTQSSRVKPLRNEAQKTPPALKPPSKLQTIRKESPSCMEALEKCKRDKYCHARGCTELGFYLEGLNLKR